MHFYSFSSSVEYRFVPLRNSLALRLGEMSLNLQRLLSPPFRTDSMDSRVQGLPSHAAIRLFSEICLAALNLNCCVEETLIRVLSRTWLPYSATFGIPMFLIRLLNRSSRWA